MADTKDYITRLQDDGAIHISEDVIASIAAAAIIEVEGVCGLSANLGSDLAEMMGKKNLSKGVRLTVGEQDEIVIDCNVVVLFGHPMMELAQNIQNAVSEAVLSMTGLKTAAVNVNIAGVAMSKPTKK